MQVHHGGKATIQVDGWKIEGLVNVEFHQPQREPIYVNPLGLAWHNPYPGPVATVRFDRAAIVTSEPTVADLKKQVFDLTVDKLRLQERLHGHLEQQRHDDAASVLKAQIFQTAEELRAA